MRSLTALKTLAVVFGVVIIILLGVLFFYNPAKAPVAPTGTGAPAPAATPPQSQ
jgi:hypothetical protein